MASMELYQTVLVEMVRLSMEGATGVLTMMRWDEKSGVCLPYSPLQNGEVDSVSL
jgi:hypothetical protein